MFIVGGAVPGVISLHEPITPKKVIRLAFSVASVDLMALQSIKPV
jgi:hypothetical protein